MSRMAIELARVTKRFGDFPAVDSLSFEVARGEVFGLLGPNGSGKTTTVNMISGLLPPTAGSIRVLGRDIADARRIRAQLGMVPQETALYEELSAEANLRFHADLFDVPRSQVQARVDAVLDLVELADRRRSRVSTFSGGMKRRLALARALVHEPDLFYLDEPTLGVDVQSRRALWDHILELKSSGKTVLISTNYLEEANVLCDRLAIVDHGKLVALDAPANLKRRFGDTVLELVLEPPASPALIERLRRLTGVTEVSQVGGTLKLSIEGERAVAGEIVGLVAGHGALKGINQRDPSLEEVFLTLTGRGLRD